MIAIPAHCCPLLIIRMATWLDLDALTKYLKMPRSTLYRLVQRKDLPGHKIGRAWRFDRDEVDAWIKMGVKRQPVSKKGSGRDKPSKSNKAT